MKITSLPSRGKDKTVHIILLNLTSGIKLDMLFVLPVAQWATSA